MPDVFTVFLNKDDDDETSGADVFSSGKKLRKTLKKHSTQFTQQITINSIKFWKYGQYWMMRTETVGKTHAQC